jgi:hypothetical protein
MQPTNIIITRLTRTIDLEDGCIVASPELSNLSCSQKSLLTRCSSTCLFASCSRSGDGEDDSWKLA